MNVQWQVNFPKECENLPIEGGWGESIPDAIRFVRKPALSAEKAQIVSMEYLIVQKLLYEELIIFRPPGDKFSGIDHKLLGQQVLHEGDRIYDHLNFEVTCWTDWHWEQLAREWEANDFGRRRGFNIEAHEQKRQASAIQFQRDFWFDITDFLS